MQLKQLTEKDKPAFNKLATHIMQCWEWGEFRASLGLPLLRYGLFKEGKLVSAFQLTLHKIPGLNSYVGYLPKSGFPDTETIKALEQIGKENNCAFIKIEPHTKVAGSRFQVPGNLKESPKPMFTKYNFVIDLTPTEDELLAKMHPKTRYNIRLASKKGVKVEVREDDEAFQIFLKLYFDTTKRQGYYGHNINYHTKAWNLLKEHGMARVVIGFFEGKPLSSWMLYNFNDTLYYPYGGSSVERKEVQANSAVAWEAIREGKRLGLKKFDLWGALGPNPDPKDPFIGFHTFKKGFGGELEEYIGTYDLVLNKPIYWAFTFIDKIMPLKIFLLKLLGKA